MSKQRLEDYCKKECQNEKLTPESPVWYLKGVSKDVAASRLWKDKKITTIRDLAELEKSDLHQIHQSPDLPLAKHQHTQQLAVDFIKEYEQSTIKRERKRDSENLSHLGIYDYKETPTKAPTISLKKLDSVKKALDFDSIESDDESTSLVTPAKKVDSLITPVVETIKKAPKTESPEVKSHQTPFEKRNGTEPQTSKKESPTSTPAPQRLTGPPNPRVWLLAPTPQQKKEEEERMKRLTLQWEEQCKAEKIKEETKRGESPKETRAKSALLEKFNESKTGEKEDEHGNEDEIDGPETLQLRGGGDDEEAHESDEEVYEHAEELMRTPFGKQDPFVREGRSPRSIQKSPRPSLFKSTETEKDSDDEELYEDDASLKKDSPIMRNRKELKISPTSSSTSTFHQEDEEEVTTPKNAIISDKERIARSLKKTFPRKSPSSGSPSSGSPSSSVQKTPRSVGTSSSSSATTPKKSSNAMISNPLSTSAVSKSSSSNQGVMTTIVALVSAILLFFLLRPVLFPQSS